MKKIGLFLIAAMAVLAFTSCNDDTDGDYPRYTPLITTVHTIGGEAGEASADYYFQRDNGEKLYPSDKTRVPNYRGKERQRAIIWFNLLKESVPDYDYNIALYAVDEIFTGKAQVVNTAEELEELGTAKTGFKEGMFNLSNEWLTFYALYAANDNSKHTFSLAVDKSGTTEFKESAEGYLDVVVRHDAGGDAGGYDCGFYVSFDLTDIAAELEGMKGINLLLPTRENGENGDKEIKLEFDKSEK